MLQNQDARLIFDARNVAAKASIDRAVATIASLIVH
jgi:hypothetical protein